ncbi:MAG: 3-deoxy-7-phosphoheptulonate synthase [Planctomycetota bacterium]|jgi:3-deoxy-7-phosphoheptulonate synthase|nr:3-deoxy-7-phosphoheptulonate synthase [Planctomycetota bacterium]
MIITFKTSAADEQISTVMEAAARFDDVEPRQYRFEGSDGDFCEVHLIGNTSRVPEEPFELLPGVRRVIRVSSKYRVIGRHGQDDSEVGFQYNGLAFDESCVHVLAGLCAVDSRESVRSMMAELQKNGLQSTRMGAYKPRTSPYDFQGLGAECLPYVFEEAGAHDIKLVAMEVCDSTHIDEILSALDMAGNPTGVMLQIGTRNTQNFELLKQVGQQGKLPVLFKRGMGITLEESLNACEYIAAEGQPNIVFCLRGVKSHLGEPHRNLVDFAHVPVVRSQTRLPVVIDPSHSVGRYHIAPDGLPEVFHATGQGLIAGASMVLVDFHPDPRHALCDGPQALTLDHLPPFLDYVKTVRSAYEAVLK